MFVSFAWAGVAGPIPVGDPIFIEISQVSARYFNPENILDNDFTDIGPSN